MYIFYRSNFILKLKTIFRVVFRPTRYHAIIFDRNNPPEEGDTLTVAGLTAEFKK